ncbi:MAG: tail fiber domain-containing protein, partial [Cyclobacteriaceae bacterium]
NQWRVSTPNEGQDLNFLSKTDTEETFTSRLSLSQNGMIGIGTQAPEKLLHVNGDLFVNTTEGSLELGAPNNGDQWHIGSSTGEALIFSSKESGSDNEVPRIVMRQDGRIGLGGLATPSGQLDIFHNSTDNSAQLTLFESEDDFARLTFRNTSFRSWSIAGYNTSDINAELLNILHSTTGNIMTFEGNGNVGVRVDNPTARLHIGQRGQSVGTGLRFSDGTANEDWDITHGFSLRLHYGGELRGFFNANTGAYVQSSDGRMKQDTENLNQVIPQLKQLQPLTYRYRNARTSEKTIGFVAQEVRSLFPELVHYSEADDIYGIDYTGFSVVAIKAIQEQQAIIETQQQSIDELLRRLESLEEKVLQTPNR